VRPEHLRDDQDQIRRGRTARQLPGQPDAHDVRHRLVERLAEQDRLGLDASDAEAEHAQPVDHRRVRVRPDQGVGEGDAGAGLVVAIGDDRSEELQVDLVDDAGAGRDDAQVAECGLGPAQELVALAVALVFALDVEGEGAGRPEPVDLDRMVDDEIGRDERIDGGRVAAEVRHRIAHDGEIDDRGHAGEVLEHDARWHEWDLGLGRDARPPRGERANVRLGHDPAAGVPEQVLEQDLDRHRGRRQVDQAGQRIEPIQVGQALAEGRPGAEWIRP